MSEAKSLGLTANKLARIASDLARITSDLDAENAKLRELVLDMYVAMWGVNEVWAENICAKRMRELGMEVNE